MQCKQLQTLVRLKMLCNEIHREETFTRTEETKIFRDTSARCHHSGFFVMHDSDRSMNSVLFNSILFFSSPLHSVPFRFFYVVLFCIVLVCSVPFHWVPFVLLHSIPFLSILFHSVSFYSSLFCSALSLRYTLMMGTNIPHLPPPLPGTREKQVDKTNDGQCENNLWPLSVHRIRHLYNGNYHQFLEVKP